MSNAPKGRDGADDSDGDFDLSGFAGGDSAPAPRVKATKPAAAEGKPAGYPAGPKIKGTFKEGTRERAPRRFDGHDPRSGAPEAPKAAAPARKFPPRNGDPRGSDLPPSRGAGVPRGPRANSRDADASRAHGGAKFGPGAPKSGGKFGPRPGAGPRPGGYEKRPPREGGFDRGPRETGFNRPPREGGFDRGPREGQRPGAGGFRGPPRDGGYSRPPRFDGPRSFPPSGPRSIERVGGDHKPVHQDIKPALPLRTDKGRWKESRFLLEGAKNISDALTVSSGIIQAVYITEAFDDKVLADLLKKNRVQVMQVTTEELSVLSDAESPQPIIAVANFATLRPDWNTARYVTLCDAVQDPGNVGAIFRTSLALGMDAVILGKGSCDAYNPKVVRSSVGALLRLPFETGEDLQGKMEFLRTKGFSIVATSSHAPITLDKAKLRKKVALIMGNEGAGTGATFLDMADAVVKIPLKNKVESLNVAVAHGILSYQLIHGRA